MGMRRALPPSARLAARSRLDRSTVWAALPLAAAFCLTLACGQRPLAREADEPPEPASVVVYSGRNENLIGPLLERFEEETGIETRVRYGGTAELAATLLEEGIHTPAAVFISQDAAALGALSGAGLFQPLPAALLARVEPRFASPRGDWVGLSGRARVVVYNTDAMAPEDLPRSLEEVTAPRYRGRFGVAPSNASFQAHMAMYHALAGRAALERLLAGMAANDARVYPKNSAIVEAVIAGEVDFGLVNHYYLWNARGERPEAPAENFFLPEGRASNFLNLAGAGVLREEPAAFSLLEFLLSSQGQEYFARETYEYPLVPGIPAAVDLVPLAELPVPEVDFERVAEVLDETLRILQRSDLVP